MSKPIKKEIYDKSTDTQIDLWIYDDKIKISIPGTNSLRDIITALTFTTRDMSNDIRINSGLLDAVISVWQDILISCRGYESRKIYISGHSLGGGLAQVVAYLLILNGFKNIYLLVQGSVRAGNKNLIKELEEKTKEFVFEWYHGDPIPWIYPWLSVPKVSWIGDDRLGFDFDLVGGAHMKYWDQ